MFTEEFIFDLQRFAYISNSTNNTLVSGTSSADSIYNTAYYVTINAGAGNDTIHNYGGDSVTIDAGAGNDTIYNYADNVTISGGAGNDSIYNHWWSSSVSLNGGAGNDTLYTRSDGGKTLTGGSGSDRFVLCYDDDDLHGTDVITDYAEEDIIQFNNVAVSSVAASGNNVVFKVGNNKLKVNNAATKTITYIDSNGTRKTYPGAAGSINNTTSNTVVSGTSGADTIYSSAENVTISGGNGNDSIYNDWWSTTASINGGAGNDTLYTKSDGGKTLTGGAGSDRFVLYYDNDDLYGTDVITDYAEEDIIQFNNVAVSSVAASGNNVVFKVGNNKLKVNNAATKTITYIDSNGTRKTYPGTAGSINNTTSNTVVSGTSGADTIYSSAENVTISGGNGNDSIYNDWWSTTASINGGAGNDTLFTKSDGGKTLTGGVGSDRFVLYYDSDDLYGTDVITDYAEEDIIQFNNVAVSSVAASGNNVVFKVGNNKLKVNNAATKTITYIDSNGTRKTYPGAAGSINNTTSNTVISGTSGNDKIYNSGGNVTINAGDGNDTIYTGDGFYTKVNGGNGNDSIYSNWGSFDTIDAGNGNDSIVIYGSGYESVNGGAGNDLISLGGSSSGFTKSIKGGTGNDTVYHGSNHYLLYQYASGDGNDIIYNWTSNDTLQIGGGSGTYSSQTSGSNIVVTVGDGSITLTGAASLSAVNISGVKRNFIENYTSNTLVSGTSGADTIYSSAENVTISGGNGNDSIYNNWWGSSISINGGAGNDTLYTKSDGGKTLTGGAGNDRFVLYYDNDDLYGTDVITDYAEGDIIQFDNEDISVRSVAVSGRNVIFTVGNNKLKVNNAATKTITYIDSNGTRKTVRPETNSWTISGTTAKYGTSSNTLITVTGVKSLGGISLNGTTVTVANSSTNNSAITISNGYTLALASDVSAPRTTKAWRLSGTTAKYNQTTTAGYTLASDAKSIAHSDNATTTLATVKGVKSLDGISLRGKVVTVSTASLGTDKVTISGTGYTLALGSDVSASRSTKAWRLSGTTAKYNQTTTAGYTLASDAKSIAHSDNATTTLATVKGVKSLDGISLRGKVVTVSTASLGTDKVTISGTGYTLALGSNVTKTSTTAAGWILNGTTATYKSASKTAGYTLANNAITHSAATAATNLATIKGATSTSGLTVSGKTIKPATASLAKKVTVSGAYTYDFAADYSKATITGSGSNDTIVARGKNILVKGGNGNDTIKFDGGTGTVTGGAGADVFYYKTSGANVITDYAEEDKISLASGTAQSLVSGDDFVLNFSGGGSVTVTGGKTKAVTYVDAGGEHVYRKNPSGVKFSNDGTSALLEVTYTLDTFDIADYAEYKDTLVTINSSAVKHKLEIMGNKNANKIIGTGEDDFIDGRAGSDNIKGGGGNDTIEGGEGNDLIYGGNGDDSLWGGAGSDTLYGNAGDDTFIYYEGNGKDVIADFERGDIIKVISARIENPYASGSDVIFEVGDSGKITIKDGTDKFIQLYGENGGELAQKWNPQRVSSS